MGVPVGGYLEFLLGKPLPGSTGAVPAFLLDRDERLVGRDPSAPSCFDAGPLRAKFRSSGWLDSKLRELARVEHEYADWDAAHGAERDTQLAELAASE